MAPHRMIDAADAILLIVDVQEAFRKAIADHALITSRIAMAVRGFRILDVPVVVLSQTLSAAVKLPVTVLAVMAAVAVPTPSRRELSASAPESAEPNSSQTRRRRAGPASRGSPPCRITDTEGSACVFACSARRWAVLAMTRSETVLGRVLQL